MSTHVHEQSRLGRDVVAKIKGMLGRGDALEDIAVWFGINIGAVRAVAAGAADALIEPAPRSALPPQGPYAQMSAVYGALSDVLEAERRLRVAASALRHRYRR
jgi:hypothetical protein